MIRTFNPGFTIIQREYDQGSSGGLVIVVPGNPNTTYYDNSTGTYYVWEEGDQGEGWYSYTEETIDDPWTWIGTDLDVSDFEILP